MSAGGGTGLAGPGIGLAAGIGAAGVFGWLAASQSDLPAVLVTVLVAMVWLGIAVAAADVVLLGYAMTQRGRLRRRWGSRGYAGVLEWWLHLSPRVIRAEGVQVRASLADLPRATRRQLDLREFGARAGRTVPGPLVPLPVWLSYQDLVLLVAPPRQGKTAWLGGALIDFPGAALAASTKPDFYNLTAAFRGRDGRPVIVCNPRELGGIASTMRWSPVVGAEEVEIADLHARAMVDGARDTAVAQASNDRFFEQRASLLLRVYLMAAAVSGLGMAEVAKWTRDAESRTPLRLIADSQGAVPVGWEEELRQLMDTTADKFRESVFFTVGVATSFMGDDRAARMCTPGPRDGKFNVKNFLDARATLYLIGNDDQGGGTIAPLFCALTANIHHHCSKLASQNAMLPGNDGRLDPPVMFALDEATQITPVPLPKWSSSSGSKGIFLVVVIQGLPQLAERWGPYGKSAILQNASVKMILGGGTEDHREISEMVGYRDERVDRQQGRSGSGTRRVPILDPAEIRRIPRWHLLAIIRSSAATIVRYDPVWSRPDIRAAGGIAPPPDPIDDQTFRSFDTPDAADGSWRDGSWRDGPWRDGPWRDGPWRDDHPWPGQRAGARGAAGARPGFDSGFDPRFGPGFEAAGPERAPGHAPGDGYGRGPGARW